MGSDVERTNVVDISPPVRPRLFYATPTGKNPKLAYVLSSQAIRMTVKSFRHEFDDASFDSGPVQMARSSIAERMLQPQYICESAKCGHRRLHEDELKSGKCPGCTEPIKPFLYDYVLMHDDDLGVCPLIGGMNAADLLYQAFQHNPNVGVAGAVYLRESPPITTVTIEHPQFKGESVNVVRGFPEGVFECFGVGTGFILISRPCLEAIQELDEREHPGGRPMFGFWPSLNAWGMTSVMGEDYDFCLRAHRAGFRVMADARIPTSHIKDNGPLNYDWASWNDPKREHKISARGIEGAVVAVINGLECVDCTPRRAKDAENAGIKLAVGA